MRRGSWRWYVFTEKYVRNEQIKGIYNNKRHIINMHQRIQITESYTKNRRNSHSLIIGIIS